MHSNSKRVWSFALAMCALGILNSLAVADEIVVPTPAKTLDVAHADQTASQPLKPAIAIRGGTDDDPLVDQVARLCQTGSLLFSRGDCMAVRLYTGSRYTHVATVVFIDEVPWVYDSMNGCGVRKLTLAEYLDKQAPDELTIYHPCRAFTVAEGDEFRNVLDREIGREYSATHFVTGHRATGVHCAEYVTDSLISIDWLEAENPVKVSPASLLEGVSNSGIYVGGHEVILSRPLEPIPEPTTWQESWWQDAKLCCAGGCRQVSRWLLCR